MAAQRLRPVPQPAVRIEYDHDPGMKLLTAALTDEHGTVSTSVEAHAEHLPPELSLGRGWASDDYMDGQDVSDLIHWAAAKEIIRVPDHLTIGITTNEEHTLADGDPRYAWFIQFSPPTWMADPYIVSTAPRPLDEIGMDGDGKRPADTAEFAMLILVEAAEETDALLRALTEVLVKP